MSKQHDLQLQNMLEENPQILLEILLPTKNILITLILEGYVWSASLKTCPDY